jgi:hypothetical protein
LEPRDWEAIWESRRRVVGRGRKEEGSVVVADIEVFL